jgi:hypothetical protein
MPALVGKGEEKVDVHNAEEAEKLRAALEKADWLVRTVDRKERRRKCDSAFYHEQAATGFFPRCASA